MNHLWNYLLAIMINYSALDLLVSLLDFQNAVCIM